MVDEEGTLVGNTFVVVGYLAVGSKVVEEGNWVVAVVNSNFVHCHQGSTDQYCSFLEVGALVEVVHNHNL